jgi:hypothetical protein
MRSALFVCLVAVAACRGKHKEDPQDRPPAQAVVDPTAPLPMGDPPPPAGAPAPTMTAPAPAAGSAAQPAPNAPVDAVPTDGSGTQPARPRSVDAGITPDANDSNGLQPEH